MATRRGFLAALLAATAAPRIGWAAAGSPAFLACAAEPDGAHALFGLTEAGEDLFRVPLPARGHAGAGHPTLPMAVVFARRPGAYALAIDCATGRVTHRLAPPAGRQFNGHGVFLDGGAMLATSEQRTEDSAGLVGLWDVAAGFARIREVPTGGLGPHDLRLMPDGATLVVANGGIATDPADRRKLNLATMRPNLAYITPAGGLAEMVELDPALRQNSIRHLALGPGGTVAFAMQWEGPETEFPPLLGLHRRGAAPILADLPETEAGAMRNYAGSIAWSGDEIALSSPRGGLVQRFGPQGRFLGSVRRADVCGLAPLPGGFLMTDGGGGLIRLAAGRAYPLARAARAWDNHVVTL